MSDLIARLIDAGTPANLIAEVAMLCARAEVDREAIESRRAKDRERQASRRHVTSRDTADVTGAAPFPAPPNENNLTPPTHTPGETPRARKATGLRLPENWKPSKLERSTVAGEVVESRGQDWARRALESFENHWRSANGPNARKADWQRAWANWVIEQDNRDGRRNGTHSMAGNRGRPPSGHGRAVDAGLAFIADGQPH